MSRFTLKVFWEPYECKNKQFKNLYTLKSWRIRIKQSYRKLKQAADQKLLCLQEIPRHSVKHRLVALDGPDSVTIVCNWLNGIMFSNESSVAAVQYKSCALSYA